MPNKISDEIPQETARHLPGLFRERVKRSPKNVAYRHFENEQWVEYSWQDMAIHVDRWQTALKREGLTAGDRVAVLLRNCPQWVMFEQAALGLGLIVVPLYTNDRPSNMGYIIQDAGIKLILLDGELHWSSLSEVYNMLEDVESFISLNEINNAHDERIKIIENWVPDKAEIIAYPEIHPDKMATIVYTSGTTGNPKGVMLSHSNILWNAASAASCEPFYTTDSFLSFLPLSHMFERTAGYYMAMLVGATVTYARSIELLADDLMLIRPTLLVTVPRIFERVYNKIKTQLEAKPPVAKYLFNSAVNVGWHRFLFQQGREKWSSKLLFWPILNKLVAKKVTDKLGGRIRLAISGGAPLSPSIAQTFIGLGLTITQGYGMTELSPVASTNLLKDNKPDTVGQPLPGVEVKLGDRDELMIRCPGVMLGYWQNDTATKEVIDNDGWLHTGDIAKLDGDHIRITGRIKEIIVLSNGEKIPPSDIELAISNDPMFEQVMILGEGKPYLCAVVVMNKKAWYNLAEDLKLEPLEKNLSEPEVQKVLLGRIKNELAPFPGYAKVFRIVATLEPWTVEAGLITPTLKLKRNCLLDYYQDNIIEMYEGH